MSYLLSMRNKTVFREEKYYFYTDGGVVFAFGILSRPIFLRYLTSVGVTAKDIDIRTGASNLCTVYANMKSVDVFITLSSCSFPPVKVCTNGITSTPLKLKIYIIEKKGGKFL